MLPLAFGFGNPVEIAIVAGVVLLLFGGSKLAGFGKSLGEGIKEFKKATVDEEPVVPVSPAVIQAPVQPPVTVGGAPVEDKK